jgi:hypothetical protein
MYFYQIYGPSQATSEDVQQKQQTNNIPTELRDGIQLNAPGENNLEKLGWLRWERGTGWNVRKGLEKITQAQVGEGRSFAFGELNNGGVNSAR